MLRRCRWLVFASLLCHFSLGRGLAQGPAFVNHELHVRVRFEKNSLPVAHVRVELLNQSGVPLNELPTDDQGLVFFSVRTGQYGLKVSGPNIEEAQSDTFFIDQNEYSRTETVMVRAKAGPARPGPAISAAALNIPDSARKEYNRGTSDFASQDFSGAEKHFARAVELHPTYSAALNNLGILAMRSGDPNKASTWFQKAIQADSSNPSPYINMAKLYAKENQASEMESSLQKAVALDPVDPEALSLLANAQLALGKTDEALATARKVHTAPHAKFAFSHLIAEKALEKKGFLRDAIEEYRIYLQEAPTGPKAGQVRNSLNTLEKSLKK